MKVFVRIQLFAAISAAIFSGCAGSGQRGNVINSDIPAYLDYDRPIEERVEDALSRMTLEEKVAILHAQSKFSSAGVPRLGIPEVWCTDGPHGIRPEVLWDEWVQAGWTNDSCTAFPALTCLAATWNRDMAYRYGKAIGEEARFRGKSVLLGPGVNINRTPLNGRNFEYMGEDPYLASQMVVPYIKGVQEQGVAACVKHFALNNQETWRHSVSVNLSDRALYEIYLPAFKAAIQEGHVWSIMPAYNRVAGEFCAHNDRLLKTILRDEFGFDGVAISDWGATEDTKGAVEGGLDLEFGTTSFGHEPGTNSMYDNYYLATPYYNLIKSGVYGTEELDYKARNVLRLIMRTSMSGNRNLGSLNSDEHILAGRTIAEEGMVLLKNDDNLLPVTASTAKIAVIGENAIKMMTVGGGSSSLKVKKEYTPLESLQRDIEGRGRLVYARGYVSNTSNEYNGVSTGQSLADDRSAEEIRSEALQVAASADMVIFIGGLNKADNQDCEGTDRFGIELPYGQDELISELAQVNPNIAVVMINGSAVAMPWKDQVKSILLAWYGGSEAGNALSDILLGKANPSGKLPYTMYSRLQDWGSHSFGPEAYPGVRQEVTYAEDILVGYRWADAKDIEPMFPFGYGLSYTTFEYGKVRVSKNSMVSDGIVKVSVQVKNTGKLAGKEVVQLYISDQESSLMRPEKELKDFAKVELNPGQSKNVEFIIDSSKLSYFDDTRHEWVAEPGKFTALVGSSSRDIKGTVDFTLK